MLRTAARPRAALPGLPELLARLRAPLAWLVVPAVALLLRYQPDRLDLAVRALAAASAVVVLARRPDLGLLSLVVGLPFQLVGLSFLYAHGVPAVVLRPLGLWKEAVVAGCALAGFRAWRAAGHRPDAIDWTAGAYLGIVALYYAVPKLLVASDAAFTGPPTDRATLNVALRTETLFVVLLVAVRHLDLGPRFRDRFARTVFATGVVVASIAIGELVLSNRWNDLMVSYLQVPRFKLDVLGVQTGNPLDIRVTYALGGRHAVRVASVFLDQLQLGLWLVAPFTVGLHRLLRGSQALFAAFGTGVISLALLATQTRGAILATAVAALCLLIPHAGVSSAARARVGALLGMGGLALLPVAVATGLVKRVVGGAGGDGGSASGHLEASRAALSKFIQRPFGRGLGTGPNGSRFARQAGMFSENYYLQVANETGVIALVLFVLLVLVVAARLGGHRDDGDLLAAAWWSAFVALSIAGMLLHVWESLSVAWTMWIGVGLVLRAGTAPDRGQPASSR